MNDHRQSQRIGEMNCSHLFIQRLLRFPKEKKPDRMKIVCGHIEALVMQETNRSLSSFFVSATTMKRKQLQLFRFICRSTGRNINAFRC